MWLYVYMSAFAKENIVGVANKYYYSLYSSAQPTDNWLICTLQAQRMNSNTNINIIQFACNGAFVVIFFKTMNNKTIIRFRFVIY